MAEVDVFITLSKRIVKYDLLREAKNLPSSEWEVYPCLRSHLVGFVHLPTGVQLDIIDNSLRVMGMHRVAALQIAQPILQALARASAGECVPIYTPLQRSAPPESWSHGWSS